MPRYKLIVEYDGASYVGWQQQTNGPSIQGALEDAAAKLCGDKCVVHGAGRTDAGVHALAMAAHVDLPKRYSNDTVRDALNQHLRPQPVAVLDASETDDDFHARFSCTGRAYEYRIANRRAPLALEARRAWRVGQRLDAEAMHAAAQVLVGQHDFTTFRAAACQSASPIKTIDAISVMRRADHVIVSCRARSFLHNQVRSFVGALVEVGRGRWTKDALAKALAAADRSHCAPVAPPDGLYFVEACYD